MPRPSRRLKKHKTTKSGCLRQAQQGGRKRLDAALPREGEHYELPVGERAGRTNGAALAEIGVEVSEQLDTDDSIGSACGTHTGD